jgi:hypothetical protein
MTADERRKMSDCVNSEGVTGIVGPKCPGAVGVDVEKRDPMIRKIVIADIDHTISDAAWRDPLIGQWEEYYREQAYDRPIEFVVNLVRLLSAERTIVAVTARPEAQWWATVKWMHDHKVPVDEIFMRSAEDYGTSPEAKCRLVREHFPDLGIIDFVLEDRDDCVAAYRQMGLNVLQVNFAGERHGKSAEAGCTYGRGEPEEPGDHPQRAEGDLRGGLPERGPEHGGPVPGGSGAQEPE